MPWKDRYTISDERSLGDSEIRWPDGKSCCLRIVVDLSPPCGPAGITAKDLTTPDAYFAMHGGLANLRDVLKRYDLRATFAVPAVIAEIHAATIRGLGEEGHEIAAHGFKHEDVSQLERAEERARLERTTAIIAAATGARPSGWFSLPRPSDKFAGGAVSPHTIDLLIEAGYEYFGNGLADDAPHYWVSDFASRRAILTLPYYYHFDDQYFLLFPKKGTGLENPEGLYRNWKAELDAQYRRGRHFSMVLHPHGIGWPSRIPVLERFLDHARGLPQLWNATSAECARHWLTHYPAATHLKLEPSIWQDHPGSLS
ncbi:MAG: polysaccharide deacetylase family protein [Alphaproteobacteria bacterium]|nr:polysaccharide deacetylase family protein [Alphaproteobacteria bacterium]MCW5744120.1 polysaccharide deacetylase family protein [Alphaproteobacteria bacterium]